MWNFFVRITTGRSAIGKKFIGEITEVCKAFFNFLKIITKVYRGDDVIQDEHLPWMAFLLGHAVCTGSVIGRLVKLVVYVTHLI